MPQIVLKKALQAHLQGRLDTAKQLYLQAIKEGAKDPAAHANLGFILKEQGELKEAFNETQKALSIAPNNALFLANAGGILLELYDYQKCIEYSLKALGEDQNMPMALSNLACAYKEIGNSEMALAAGLKSLQLQPNNPITLTSLGYIFMSLNESSKALGAALDAIKLDPSLSSAYTLKGKALAAQGNTKEAISAYTQALTLNKDSGEALLGLSMDIKTARQATELIKLADKVDTEQSSIANKISLYYSYANFYHKIKDYKNAELNLCKAHQTKGSVMPSDAEWHCKQIKDYMHIPYIFKNQNHTKDHSRIFIVGMPRSGSTLLETVLSVNPEIQDLGETKALGIAIDAWLNKSGESSSLDVFYKQALNTNQANLAKYTIDKQLYNFKLTGYICSSLPKAKIIHCKRNPLDNILSMLRTQLSTGNNYTINAKDCAKVLIQQEKIMKHFKQAWRGRIYTFNYDSFVVKPEATLRPLIEWLDLEWKTSYMHPEQSKRSINTASVIQARKPINKASLSGWKNYQDLLKPAFDLIIQSKLFNDFDLT